MRQNVKAAVLAGATMYEYFHATKAKKSHFCSHFTIHNEAFI